jgi:hypothetical protein
MVEIVATEEFKNWFDELSEAEAEAVTFSVEVLREKGVTLGHPHSSAIQGADEPLRELRVQAKGRPIRVLYAFDPLRRAVLLLGGDKTGKDRFYEVMVPKAERIWRQFLVDLSVEQKATGGGKRKKN